MIIETFRQPHSSRVEALKSNRRLAVCVHEAGHVTMMDYHKMNWRVNLPRIRAQTNGHFVVPNASVILDKPITEPDVAIDVCFGGYCAELAFMDEAEVKSGSKDFFVNASAARNDILMLGKLGIHNFKKEHRDALNSSEEVGAQVVHAMFRIYAKHTYELMLSQKASMLAYAQSFHDKWSAANYDETRLTNGN